MSDGKPKGFHFLPDYAIAIAEAATSWAALEYSVNSTIWALADVKPGMGACITAHIFTMNAKLDALISLLRFRRAPKGLITDANTFVSSFRDAQEARNRIIHDYWMNDLRVPEKMGKMVVTAQRMPRFKIISVPIAELQSDVQKVHNRRYQFEELRRRIQAALPTLPSIPHEELYPIEENQKPL
jgi:hypothetical protein